MNDTLIKLEGLTKVFLTDEVETRVLWDINLEIKRGDYAPLRALRDSVTSAVPWCGRPGNGAAYPMTRSKRGSVLP